MEQNFVGQIFSSNGTPRARGVAVLIKTDRVTGVNLVYGDKEGRVIVIDCMYETKNLRIINIYAPNGEKERKTFFIEISKWWEGNCVIISDFNVAMTPTDVSKNNVGFRRATLSATVIFGFFFTSLTKALLPQLLSLAGRPGLGRVLVIPNVFHLRIMEATVLLGTLSAAEILL
uniref:Endonuclease/exonuclease/phosphatase domain-containing protein n=1 Tax=Labrus bergylta TaxID=56723 RepID=A0A3Q3L475_9LABR